MMDKRKPEMDLTEAELDALFRAADAEAPLPSGDVMARILADADALQAAPAAAVAPAKPQSVRDLLGGWLGLSGLAGAVAAGLVIGVLSPDALGSYADYVVNGGVSVTDYLPGLTEVSFDG